MKFMEDEAMLSNSKPADTSAALRPGFSLLSTENIKFHTIDTRIEFI
jgi:hypothetical protein